MTTNSGNVSMDLLNDPTTSGGPTTSTPAYGLDAAESQPQSTPYYPMETSAATPGVPPVPDYMENDDGDDGHSVAESIVESVFSADGIHDPTGFKIVCFIILIGDMARGVMFPTLFPLVEELGGSDVTVGYTVAAFSFGRILVSPTFGQWSITYGYSKTLLLASSILLVGTLLYSQAQNVGRVEFLILAQTILGVGSGTLGVTRAFVAEVTAKRNRTTYMAWITAVQYAGFTVTPFIGSLFSKLLGESEFQASFFRLNMYTAPAYFMSLVVTAALVTMGLFFRDRQRMQTTKKKSTKQAQIEDYANQTTFIGLTIYDCCILGCLLLNVSTKGSISSFETLGVAIADKMFELEASRAGTIVATCGTIGVFSLLSMGSLSRQFTDIQLICSGMVVMAGGILSLSFIDEEADNPSWKYVVAIFMIYSVGYPIGHTAVIGLFSKIVGRRPQGLLLGWFASAGSAARIMFPIMSGYISEYAGFVTLAYVLVCILGASTIFTLLARKTLAMLSG